MKQHKHYNIYLLIYIYSWYQIVGTSRSPTLKDRGSLPYTEAMIQETQRLANIGN